MVRPEGCGLSERTLNDPVQHCDALVADFADCTKIMAWTQVAPQQAPASGRCSEALLVSTGKASVEATTRSDLKLVLVCVSAGPAQPCPPRAVLPACFAEACSKGGLAALVCRMSAASCSLGFQGFGY